MRPTAPARCVSRPCDPKSGCSIRCPAANRRSEPQHPPPQDTRNTKEAALPAVTPSALERRFGATTLTRAGPPNHTPALSGSARSTRSTSRALPPLAGRARPGGSEGQPSLNAQHRLPSHALRPLSGDAGQGDRATSNHARHGKAGTAFQVQPHPYLSPGPNLLPRTNLSPGKERTPEETPR